MNKLKTNTMKKLFLLFASIFTIASGFGQSESSTQPLTSTSDKFCIVDLLPNSLKNNYIIKLEYDANMDSAFVNQLKKVPSSFKKRLEILNYMSSIGWTFISSAIFSETFAYNVYYFKKSFPKKEDSGH
jgi:hypothetical protein